MVNVQCYSIDNVEDSAWILKSLLKVSRTHYTDKLINTNPGWRKNVGHTWHRPAQESVTVAIQWF